MRDGRRGDGGRARRLRVRPLAREHFDPPLHLWGFGVSGYVFVFSFLFGCGVWGLGLGFGFGIWVFGFGFGVGG